MEFVHHLLKQHDVLPFLVRHHLLDWVALTLVLDLVTKTCILFSQKGRLGHHHVLFFGEAAENVDPPRLGIWMPWIPCKFLRGTESLNNPRESPRYRASRPLQVGYEGLV